MARHSTFMQIIPIITAKVEPEPQQVLVDWIQENVSNQQQLLCSGDILILSSKIVSYFEGGLIDLSTITPTIETFQMAKRINDADPRLIQLSIDQAEEVVSETPWVLLTRKNGIYSANSGVDTSNVPKGMAVVWPKDPFKSAYDLKKTLQVSLRIDKLSVLIIDSSCQPGRKGTIAVAIGYSGIVGFQELKGAQDLYGNTLRYSALNIVDSLATAANLVMGESDESCPMAIIRGYAYQSVADTKKGEMVIPPSEDLYQL
jgi:coenzyme F420-0:L-glutamate ligase/coenzyme F420-1:gamma-L-glutamate ligase